LNEIEVSFTDWGNNTASWVYGVETTDGTFICPQSLLVKYGPSYIPEGWKVIKTDDPVIPEDPDDPDPNPDPDPNNPNSPDGSLAPITQTPESAAKSTCPGNFAEVELKFNGIDRPYRYKVMGIHSDFQEWKSDKNIIEIPISDDETEFGIKKYTIDFQYEEPASGSPDHIDVDVIVNFPKDYIKVIYEDIVYVDNGKHEFTDFQWVDSDGNEINNANRQFMQVLDLPQNGGQYSVKVTTESGVSLKICPQDIDPVDISKSIRCSASVYPNPIEANKEFSIKLNGFSDAMLENCNVYIYSSTGALIRTFQGVGSEIKTSLPSGSYSGTAVSGNTKTTFKLFVK
ncbi:MAG: T9SS type A sorting domain-containing protein, partial [Bacteroidales bacterium]|nr:T9SS type A sorting domain-containing protein [Bacteroidales bacterium]